MRRRPWWLPLSEWEPDRRDAFVDAAKRVFPGSYEPFRGEGPMNGEVEAMERHLDSIKREMRDGEQGDERQEQLDLDQAA
jgi:hypothetical protein